MRWRYVAVGLSGVCVLGLLAVLVVNREVYGDFWPYNLPERVSYCGDRYTRVPGTDDGDGKVVNAAQGLDDAYKTQLAYAFTIHPGGWQVYRTNDWKCPESDQEQHDQYLFLQTGPNQYLELTDAD